MTKIVKFVKHYNPYNVGDGAAFDTHRAKALVDAGIAKYVAASAEQKTPAVETKVVKPTKSDDVITKG